MARSRYGGAVVRCLDITADKPPEGLAATYNTPERWASLCRRIAKSRERWREQGAEIEKRYIQTLLKALIDEVASDEALARKTEHLRRRMAKRQSILNGASESPVGSESGSRPDVLATCTARQPD